MKKKSLLKNIFIICGLFVVLIAATFSWFVMNDSGNIENLETTVIDAAYIMVSKDEGLTWENNLDMDLGTGIFLRETTGDGVTFFEPVYDGVDSVKDYSQTPSENVCFDSFITFKTDRDQSIYLTDDSFVLPADYQDDVKNKSEFGDYSKDYIAGAIRVGFFEVTDDGDYDLAYIWIPNTKICYDAKNNSITEDGTVEEYYSYYANGEEPGFIKIKTNGSADGISGNFLWGSLEQKDAPPVLTFDKDTEAAEDGTIAKKLAIRVWVEGTDRECVRALYQGKFKMYFKFQAVREVSNNEE